MVYNGYEGQEIKENRGGLSAVILLALLLCGVFFLAVGAYGLFAEGEGMVEGNLPNAVLVLREFVEENEAVSVFLGFSDTGTDTGMGAEDAARAERIAEAVEKYIQEKQPPLR